jgi:D-alanine transaminase
MNQVYLNGEFMPLEKARVSVLDRGFLFGDGVYEVIPVYGGKPFRLAEHLNRLEYSLAAIRLTSPLTREQWARVFEGVVADAPENQSLYVQVTRGAGSDRNHLFPADAEPTVFAMCWEAKPRRPEIVRDGVAAITLDDLRWLRCDVKSVALLGNVLLRQAAEDAGTEESILIRDGQVTEGSSTNVFLVENGEIATPPKTNLLLPGITRDLVIELAERAGMACTERGVSSSELTTADEIWLSSSTREVVPVTRLDDHPVGDGKPGPVWRRIDGIFQDFKAALGADAGQGA